MALESEIKTILAEVLQVDTEGFDNTTLLLGAIPELDSMGVVSLLTELEDKYAITLADDEIDASVFESVGTLVDYVNERRS